MIGLFVLCSCTRNDVLSETEIKKAQYSAEFEGKFGKISPTQTWGFGKTKQGTTRSAYPNGNMWESEGYTVPSDITESERAKVLAVFKEKGAEKYESLVDWDCFFVQQVYKGDSIYTAGNGGKVIGAEHMDWLVAYDPIGYDKTIYPAYNNGQPTIIKSHDDHVNDFNNSYSNDFGGRMLMINSSTKRFGFRSSEDSQMHYTFRMEEIDGNYYVGLDFEATGDNPNQKVPRDFVYDDWIIKVVKGKPSQDFVKEEGMIICEDLGTTDDFDFNDVVFYAKVWNSGKTEITLLAAGGTLNLTVAGKEVHEAFEVSQATMVNTGYAEKDPYYFVAENKYNGLIDIPVIVSKQDIAGNVTSYALTAEMGKAPQKICVPIGFKWCKEKKSLVDAYEGFKSWTQGSSDTWANGKFDKELVVDFD